MESAPALIIIKIGGSVITDKRRPWTPLNSRIDSVASELAHINERYAIVNGAGSFGHPIVKKHKIHLGYRNRRQLLGVAEAKYRLSQLTSLLLEALWSHKIPVIPFTTSSIVTASGGRLKRVTAEPLLRMVRQGFVPLMGGDIVYDTKTGFSVVSGDQICHYLAKKLNARMVIFGSDVDGVFTGDPKKNPAARLIPIVREEDFVTALKKASGAGTPDVTKGMLGKLLEVRAMLRDNIPVTILNLTKKGVLRNFLSGRDISCTKFVPSR